MTASWPLFDLVVRTPRLELRLPREDEFDALNRVADLGVHDPGTMPFFVSWTDLPPAQRAIESAQWFWKNRANWAVDDWTFTAAVYVEGQPVGVQDLAAKHFRAVRSVETGSWLGQPFQGQGIGKEMRQAILHLAFAGLDAREALSGAFEDNLSSIAVSRAVGYAENGEARAQRRDTSGRTIRFRMGRDDWDQRRRDDIEITGLDGCLQMFVGPTLAAAAAAAAADADDADAD
jgi:RimJ/RimL family protein N-acetyltransferase